MSRSATDMDDATLARALYDAIDEVTDSGSMGEFRTGPNAYDGKPFEVLIDTRVDFVAFAKALRRRILARRG